MNNTKEINVQNLIFLVFAANPCYIKVTDKKPKDVTINLVTKTWFRNGDHEPHRSNRIGSAIRQPIKDGGAIIGVYDRTNINHLNAMAGDIRDATYSDSGSIDCG
ncbi:MAG: hypothetical protein WCP93_00235 [Candidatus Berkelbacteria bacterium]